MADEFDQLLPFKWRDVELPVTQVKLSLAHDLVEHKYWGVDSGRVEATGVAPIRISAQIPLSNRIVPGKNERWVAGALYPDALRNLLIAFARRQTGLLQHPEFGEIACKAERIDVVISGERRNTAMVDASWVETLDDDVISNIVASPVTEIELAASDLDASDADLRKLVPELPKYETTFDDFARAIAAIGDQVSLLSYRTAGKINSIVYRAEQISESVDRARSALTWPAKQNIERIKTAAHDLRGRLLALSRDIGLYRVLADSTLAGIHAVLPDGNAIGDLVKLNPHLMTDPVIKVGTLVRHYVSRVPV
jgi:prophage DNA circulation protein